MLPEPRPTPPAAFTPTKTRARLCAQHGARIGREEEARIALPEVILHHIQPERVAVDTARAPRDVAGNPGAPPSAGSLL